MVGNFIIIPLYRCGRFFRSVDFMSVNLSAREKKTVAAVGEILFPAADAGDLVHDMDQIAQMLGPRARRMLRWMLLGLELSTLPTHLTRFSKLGYRKRRACFNRRFRMWMWHQFYHSIKAFSAIAYMSRPSNMAALGYDGKPFKTPLGDNPRMELPVTVAYPEINADIERTVDAVIIGSGAGGATVARELALAGLEVAVVEEGSDAIREDFQEPQSRRFLRFYRDSGFTMSLGNTGILIPIGQAVGGTTTINSGTCFRTPPFVLESWGRHGVRGVEPGQMAPLFDEIERDLSVQPVKEDIMGKNGSILRRGAIAMGLKHGPISRPTKGCHGTGQCVLGCPRDAKLDMRLTYLPRVVASGGKIYSRCRAEKILLQRGRAQGIAAAILDEKGRNTGRVLTVKAHAVVLAAGALGTPSLLIRNRLGNRQVGRNLRIHPCCVVSGRFSEEIRGWQGVLQSYFVDEWIEEGLLLEATFPPPGIGYGSFSVPLVHFEKEGLDIYRHIAEVGVLVSDSSRGRVRVGPDKSPWTSYFLNGNDMAKMLKGIGRASRIMFAAGASEVYPGLSRCEVLRAVREISPMLSRPWKPMDLTLSAFHPMGTCRMGEDPELAATDSHGEVHGVPGLFVADASLLPSSIHVNPQITIMALALRVARRIIHGAT